MKLVIRTTLAAVLALTSALAAAQTPRSVTLDEAISLALENNMSLESASIDLRLKERANDLSWNVFLPELSVSGTLAKTNMTEGSATAWIDMGGGVFAPQSISYEIPKEARWSAIAGLSMDLTLSLAMIDGIRATRQDYEAGLITWEQAKADTGKNVSKMFYGILLQEGSLSIARDKFRTSEERMRQTEINYRNGLVPELAWLQTQLAVETQKPQLMEAELALTKQKDLFAFLLGLPAGTQVELKGKIEPVIQSFKADELVNGYLGNNQDLALLAKNIQMLNTRISALKLQRYTPVLILSKSWKPILGSALDTSWTDLDNWNDSSGALSFTLAFDLTGLLPFSGTAKSLEDAKDSLAKLELGRAQAAYNTELEIRDLARKLDKARASIAAMELSVNIAEKAYRLSEQGYRAGTVEYLDLKDAEASLMQARLGVLSEKYNYLSTLMDLESVVNAKLDK